MVLDLPQVIESLQSSKIKTRNDALNLLSEYSIQNLKLPSKHFSALCRSLLKTIQEERVTTNSNSSAAQRITSALTILHELIENALCYKNSSPRYKVLCDFGIDLIAIYYSIEGLPNCESSKSWAAKILNLMLRDRAFYTHLSKDLWLKYYNFCVRAIQMELKPIRKLQDLYDISNESLLNVLLSMILRLVGINTRHTISCITTEVVHRPLLSLLQNVYIRIKKKESALNIFIMKIINKLLVLLAAEDVWFCYCLVDLGVNITLHFATTSTESLLFQLLLFVNIDYFHTYINLDFLPVQTSSALLQDKSVKTSNRNVQLYNIERILYIKMKLLCSQKFRLFDWQFAPTSSTCRRDWFYLRNFKLASDNKLAWLLVSGIAKLLTTYYKISLLSRDLRLMISSHTSLKREFCSDEPSPKRKKSKDKKSDLSQFDSPVDFLNHILDVGDPKEQVGALQILAFVIEHTGDPLFQEDQEFLKFIALFESVTALVSDIPFWSLLVCRSILKSLDLKACRGDTSFNSSCHYLLKICTLYVKEKVLYKIACDILYILVEKFSSEESLFPYFDDILDSPITNGPPSIGYFSCLFWVSMVKVFARSSPSKNKKLQLGITSWIVEVCNYIRQTAGSVMASHKKLSRQLPVLFCWLMGKRTELQNLELDEGYIADEFFFQMKRSLKLVSFLTLHQPEFGETKKKVLYYPEFTVTAKILQKALNDIALVFDNEVEGVLAADELIHSALVLANISTLCEQKFVHESLFLRAKATDMILTLTRYISDRGDAMKVISTILHSIPPKLMLEGLNFPFEVINHRLRRSQSYDSELSLGESKIALEDEFSQSKLNNSEYLARIGDDGSCIEQSKYLRFLVECDDATFEVALSDPSLSPQTVLFFAEECIDCIKESRNDNILKLVRLLGEKCLATQEFERDFDTILVCCRALEETIFEATTSLKTNSDCEDMLKYLLSLEQNSLVSSDECLAHIRSLKIRVQALLPKRESLSHIIGEELVLQYSNSCRAEILTQLIKALALKPATSTKWETLKALAQKCFQTDSMDKNAIDCLILLNYVVLDRSYSLAVTQYLTIEPHEPYLVPYKRLCLSLISAINEKTIQDFLHTHVYLLLKAWYVLKGSFKKFPYDIYLYNSLENFFQDNFQPIITILYSVSGNSEAEELNSRYNKLRGSTFREEQNIWIACLPKAIPLAFTPNGARKDLFQFLGRQLKGQYEPTLRELLPIIILETLKMTDYSDESALRSAVGKIPNLTLFTSKEVLEEQREVKISPSSSHDLISALIEKYFDKNKRSFWTESSIWFLLRRLNVSKVDVNALQLRAVKFLLCIANYDFEPNMVSVLLIEACSNHLLSDLVCDVVNILNFINFKCLQNVSPERLNSIILGMMSKLLQLEKIDSLLSEIIDKLERYFHLSAQDSSMSKDITKFYTEIVSFLKKPNKEFDIEVLELFLENPTIENTFGSHQRVVFTVISELFPFVQIAQSKRKSKKLIKLFLDHKFLRSSNLRFQVKVAEYLGTYYLEEVTLADIRNYATLHENGPLKNHSLDNSFYCLLEFLGKELHKEDPQVVSYCECVIGVLMFYQETIPENTGSFYATDTLYQILCFPLYPMSFEVFSMLYSEEDLDSEPRSQEALKFPIEKENFAELVRFLYLSVFDLMKSTLKALLVLRSLATHMSCELASILPDLLCFSVSACGKKGAELVQTVVLAFCRNINALNCVESINFLKDIVIGVRNRSLQGQKAFSSLYKSFDLRNLFFIFENKMFSKTSLLLFEDCCYGADQPLAIGLFQEQLQQIYISLDELDHLAGLPEKFTVKNSLEALKLSASSNEKLQYESASFDTRSFLKQSIQTDGILQALLQEGLNGIPMLFNDNIQPSYEWAWKLNQWEMPSKPANLNKNDAIYSYFHQINSSQAKAEITYSSIMSDLVINGKSWQLTSYKQRFESIAEYFETLGIICTINSISTANVCDFELLNNEFVAKSAWLYSPDSFFALELLQARGTAFDSYKSRLGSNSVSKELALQAGVSEVVRYNELARRWGLQQKYLNSTVLLDGFISQSEILDTKLQRELERRSSYQAAKAFWMQGKNEIAISMLDDLAKDGSIVVPFDGLSINQQLIDAYKLKWMSEAHFDSGENLLHKSLEPMISSLSEVTDLKQQEEVYFLLADFCDKQASSAQLSSKIKELEHRINARKQEVDEIKSHYGKILVTSGEKKKVQKYYSRLKSQIGTQTTELETLNSLKREFRCYSVQFYLKCILIECKESVSDKFFSLLLEQASDLKLQKSIEKDLATMATSIAVGWVTQLLSRLSTESSVFQTSIQNLLSRVCLEHPYHSLYYLTSLELHEELANENDNLGMASRVKAAKQIHQNLYKVNGDYATKYSKPIDRFCEMCVQLAKHKAAKSRYLLLDKLKFGNFWMNELPRIPPPTLFLPVSSTGYDHVPVINLMESEVAIATSGLSLPKIVTFLLSNGECHRMLLKHSQEDIRQDAIMEQVFEKVNTFMSQDSGARKRKLAIRTYRAVPLGPKDGIIEFVPNTKALIEILRPYHQIQDTMKMETARELMKNAQNEDGLVRLKVYQDIMAEIKPVLRNFFLETFRGPDNWFESRLAYTRGIAATSMVGHILGLGDRHCNNILLDGSTGEPIHIDLGVAFDQGKRLPIPETVPFRLTRDIVDGFGVTGTRGLFSKACEHTLQVLRANETRIISMLDVLRWDPLYSWSISPIRLKTLQETGEDEVNLQPREDGSDATTAILTVREKINAGGLSVSANVRDLIGDATNEQNLAVIYCGWCPFY